MLDRPKLIADEISKNISSDEMEKAISNGDKDRRCGLIGMLLGAAVERSNLAVHKGGTEFWWDPSLGHWVELSEGEMDIVAETLIFGLKLDPGDIFKREPRLKQMAKGKVRLKKLSPKRDVIAFKNCVLDIKSGKTDNLSPKYHCTYGLNYNYDPVAKCERWISFLEQILPDVDSRAVLQEYLGCIFINRREAKLEKILYLYGGALTERVLYQRRLME